MNVYTKLSLDWDKKNVWPNEIFHYLHSEQPLSIRLTNAELISVELNCVRENENKCQLFDGKSEMRGSRKLRT